VDEPRTHARRPPYENDCIGVFTIRDGRIQRVREYMDTRYAGEVAFGGAPCTVRRCFPTP
jgi:ketosteroid isomerase-like protein